MHMASQHLRGLRTHQRQGEQHQELHLLKVSLKQQEPQTSLWGNIGSKRDEEHYDNQKVNGLTLPTTIKASSWTQLKDIDRMRPPHCTTEQMALPEQ